ncbi:hypothetical protein EK21DRAFT_114581 [Setomelanomma holmii]|uniref:Uncharacterized protein n=1 Tax=Setomelanomma holmii TaxID=210430 RepID=A0A9P4H428_9PLEO|nr:hypothetical protein EK21DRAFT_114581 [Setomelanomma holmii]
MSPKKGNKPKSDSVYANWISADPYDYRHQQGFNHENIAHPSNDVNHGFGTDRPALVSACPNANVNIFPHKPKLDTVDDEAKYIELIENKLITARDFIKKEWELGLDANRNMNKDPTAVELTKGDMMLTFRTQEVIRDLVNYRPEITRLAEDQEANAESLQLLLAHFSWCWKELKGIVVTLVPGPNYEERLRRTEIIMTNTLGENMVEESVEMQETNEMAAGGMDDNAMDVNGV